MQQQEAISLKPQSIQATIQHTYDALNLYVVKEQRHNAAKKGAVHSIKKAPSFAQKEEKTAHDFASPSATQYLLIDILREECLVLQQKLADTLEYNHLLTESNAQSIYITQAASASAKDADYKLTVNQLISPLTTQYLLIDVVREECLAIQKKLIHNLEYIDLLTQSNAESVALSKKAR